MQQTGGILPSSGSQKKPQYSSSEASDEEDEEEDIRDLEGRTYTKMGREVYIYIYIYIQGVTGGTDQSSGECSLGQTIPI